MFRKFLSILILSAIIIQPAWAVTQFTVNVPTSAGDLKSNFPAEVVAQWTILQTLLQNYRQGYALIYNNASTLNIGSGEISVWNGSAALWLQNTGAQTATTANLDVGGSFTASTTYYVYCGTSSTAAATCTVTISLNNAAPTGVTYYKQIGTFTTDSSGNISQITNSNHVGMAQGVAKSVNTTYQATTDGFVTISALFPTTNNNYLTFYTDMSSSPSTVWGVLGQYVSGAVGISLTMTIPVVKGNYYKLVQTGSAISSLTYYFTSYGQ